MPTRKKAQDTAALEAILSKLPPFTFSTVYGTKSINAAASATRLTASSVHGSQAIPDSFSSRAPALLQHTGGKKSWLGSSKAELDALNTVFYFQHDALEGGVDGSLQILGVTSLAAGRAKEPPAPASSSSHGPPAAAMSSVGQLSKPRGVKDLLISSPSAKNPVGVPPVQPQPPSAALPSTTNPRQANAALRTATSSSASPRAKPPTAAPPASRRPTVLSPKASSSAAAVKLTSPTSTSGRGHVNPAMQPPAHEVSPLPVPRDTTNSLLINPHQEPLEAGAISGSSAAAMKDCGSIDVLAACAPAASASTSDMSPRTPKRGAADTAKASAAGAAIAQASVPLPVPSASAASTVLKAAPGGVGVTTPPVVAPGSTRGGTAAGTAPSSGSVPVSSVPLTVKTGQKAVGSAASPGHSPGPGPAAMKVGASPSLSSVSPIQPSTPAPVIARPGAVKRLFKGLMSSISGNK